MIRTVAAFLLGAMFAVGLVVSGMTQPAKVIGFLDIAGDWDPALGLVMVAAIGTYLPAWLWIRRRRAPVLDSRFHWPSSSRVDARLLGGSALFGVGWGLSGFCPGPGIVGLAGGMGAAAWFMAGLAGGMLSFAAWTRVSAPAPSVDPAWVTDG